MEFNNRASLAFIIQEKLIPHAYGLSSVSLYEKILTQVFNFFKHRNYINNPNLSQRCFDVPDRRHVSLVRWLIVPTNVHSVLSFGQYYLFNPIWYGRGSKTTPSSVLCS